MSSLFEDLKEGLQEAIEFEKGKEKTKTTTFIIDPVKNYSNEEIKRVRNNAGMTQAVFANYLGVSKKTVEAWELGKTHPTGPANRLIEMLETGKADNLEFISKV